MVYAHGAGARVRATPIARRSRPMPAPASLARRPDGPPAARARVDRLEVCLDCEAYVAGAPTSLVPGDLDLREIERGVARLSAPNGRRTTLRSTGVAVGERLAPCACCRRPVAGARAVLERTVGVAPGNLVRLDEPA